jgi:hypothetical protein
VPHLPLQSFGWRTSCKFVDCDLLSCDTVWSCRWLRHIWEEYVASIFTITTQKTTIDIFTTVRTLHLLVRFKVLAAASMKMTVFWDVAPCCLVEVYRRFRGTYCPPSSGRTTSALNMETVCFSETLASTDESTRRQYPEEQRTSSSSPP